MREIKFRAWDKKNKLMEYSGHMTVQGEYYKIGFELMQYTGLEDKNGVEIYEGDIVAKPDTEYSYNSIRGEVVFGTGTYDSGVYKFPGFYIKAVGSSDTDGSANYFYDDDLEVIGNIHGNPELLEEQS